MDRCAFRIDRPAGETIGALLAEGRETLSAAGIEHAEQETIWLLEAALKASQLTIRFDLQRAVSQDDVSTIRDLLARRAHREPLQYLLGTQEFCGLEFEVTPSVLIPRPESELLLEEIVRFLFSREAAIVVDVGTGSGCLAVALAKALSTVRVYALDCSEPALEVARHNAARHGVSEQVHCLQSDLLHRVDPLNLEGKVNVVMSNPPYIPDSEWIGLQPEVRLFEPQLALRGGSDGILFHRRLLQESPTFLVPGGMLVMEVGQGQAASVCDHAREQQRYGNIRVREDAAGIGRVVCAELVE